MKCNMNKHEYQRTHNLHKNIYEKFDYIILQIIKTSWTNINTPKKNPSQIWENNFTICQNMMSKHKHKNCHHKFDKNNFTICQNNMNKHKYENCHDRIKSMCKIVMKTYNYEEEIL